MLNDFQSNSCDDIINILGDVIAEYSFAAMNSIELQEWLDSIDSCCSMGENVVRRRHLGVSPDASPQRMGNKENQRKDLSNDNEAAFESKLETKSTRKSLSVEVLDSDNFAMKPPVRRKASTKGAGKSSKTDSFEIGDDTTPMATKKTSKRPSRPPSPSIDSNSDITAGASPVLDSPFLKGARSSDKKRAELPPRPHRSPLRGRNIEYDEVESGSPMNQAQALRRKPNQSISKLSKVFDKSSIESEEDQSLSGAGPVSVKSLRPFNPQNRMMASPAPNDDDSTIDDNESVSSVNSFEKRRDSMKSGSVKIVKFRNLLNSNGLDAESPLNPKSLDDGKEEVIVEKAPEVKKEKVKYNPKELPIENRPSGHVREGYLYKLDGDSFDVGEDSWIKQFVSLDITVGTLCHFAEINGRKILRGRFSVLTSETDLIDEMHYGQQHSFKIFPKPVHSEEVGGASRNASGTATFAADDRETLHYWLISFDDCFEYLKEKTQRDIEEAAKAEEARLKAEKEAAEKAAADEEVAKKKEEVRQLKKKHSFVLEKAHELEDILRSSRSADDAHSGPSLPVETAKSMDLKDLLVKHSKELHHVSIEEVEKAHQVSPGHPIEGAVSSIHKAEESHPAPSTSLTPAALPVKPAEPIPKPSRGKFNAVANLLQMNLNKIFNKDSESTATDVVASETIDRYDEPAIPTTSTAPVPPHSLPPHDLPPALETSKFDKDSTAGDHSAPIPSERDPVPVPVPIPAAAHVPVPVPSSHPSEREHEHVPLVEKPSPLPLSSEPRPYAEDASSESAAPEAVPPLSLPVPPPPSVVSLNEVDVYIPQIRFAVKKVKYPAERLARRIKIWYCSSGFSLSTEQEIEQFVNELQLTGDNTLQSFSQEKFDNILDWAHLLEVLRKYEGSFPLSHSFLDHDMQ